MSITRHRKWTVIIALIFVLIEIGAVVLSYRANDILTTALFISGNILALALLVLLLSWKGDRIFRMMFLIPLLGYLAFKLWVLIGFLMEVD